MRYKLGIDLGTSYFKFGIYDQNLDLKGLGRIVVEKDTGDGSSCEVPSQKFVHLLQTGINLACQEAGILPVLTIGGFRDLRDLFSTLKTAKRDDSDDGRVVGHHNLADEVLEKDKPGVMEELKSDAQENL